MSEDEPQRITSKKDERPSPLFRNMSIEVPSESKTLRHIHSNADHNRRTINFTTMYHKELDSSPSPKETTPKGSPMTPRGSDAFNSPQKKDVEFSRATLAFVKEKDQFRFKRLSLPRPINRSSSTGTDEGTLKSPSTPHPSFDETKGRSRRSLLLELRDSIFDTSKRKTLGKTDSDHDNDSEGSQLDSAREPKSKEEKKERDRRLKEEKLREKEEILKKIREEKEAIKRLKEEKKKAKEQIKKYEDTQKKHREEVKRLHKLASKQKAEIPSIVLDCINYLEEYGLYISCILL